MKKKSKKKASINKFQKSETGIQGLDDLTIGGIPKNRPTLLVGNSGTGKTLLAIQYMINGAEMFGEPGVFMSFEEKIEDLTANVISLGYDLDELQNQNKIYLENIEIGGVKILQTGEYSIEGLFVRIEAAIKKVKAKRVVLDSIDTLFSGLNETILRSEFHRLFFWLKEQKVTTIITAEAGDVFLTRFGIEEYIADCVILLDNRVKDQISTRRLRIVKYRGSPHGNNEYPFIIDEKGCNVFPIISEKVQFKVSSDRISSGIKTLDKMMGGKGFYLGSSILISGTAGTGKTSIAASFAYNACKLNHSALYCAFEESPNQIMRNLKSISIDLTPYINSKQLLFYYSRPTLQNLELHFISIKKIIREQKPTIVILDPITNLMTEGPNSDIRSMLTRFVDYLKTEQVTVFFTAAITAGSIVRNPSDEGISSMVDTWIMVEDIDEQHHRFRTVSVIKSRGMTHSHEVKKMDILSKGISISPIENRKQGPFPEIKKREKEL